MPVDHQSHLSKCPATSSESTALASVQGHPGLHLTCTISCWAPRPGLSDHRCTQCCHWVITAVLAGQCQTGGPFLKAARLGHHLSGKVAQPSGRWLIRDKMFSHSQEAPICSMSLSPEMVSRKIFILHSPNIGTVLPSDVLCTTFTLNLPPLPQFGCVVQFITFYGERSWEYFSFHELLLLPQKRRAAVYGEPFSIQCGGLLHQTICGEMFLWEENPKIVFTKSHFNRRQRQQSQLCCLCESLGKIMSSASPWRLSSPKCHPPQCEESTPISVSQSPKGSQDRA